MLESMAAARQPAALPHSRLAVSPAASAAQSAHMAVYRRALNSLLPNSVRESAVAQYCKGGFSM